MKKNILFVFIFLLSMITFASCSQDDDNGGPNGNFSINGEGYSVEIADCSNGLLEETITLNTGFEATLLKGADIYTLYICLASTYTLDGIRPGDDLTKPAYVADFGRGYSLDRDFDEAGGKVTVKSVSDKTITLEFSDYAFDLMDRKGNPVESYVINGVIEYKRVLNPAGQ